MQVNKHRLHLPIGPWMKLKGIDDCMNSKEECNHFKLKAEVRALGTNKESGDVGIKKGKYLILMKREGNLGIKNVLVDRNNSE